MHISLFSNAPQSTHHLLQCSVATHYHRPIVPYKLARNVHKFLTKYPVYAGLPCWVVRIGAVSAIAAVARLLPGPQGALPSYSANGEWERFDEAELSGI